MIAQELAPQFKKLGVTFDTTVARVEAWMRMPGTPNRKGAASRERPHGVAHFIEVPQSFREAVSAGLFNPLRKEDKDRLDTLIGRTERASFALLERLAGAAIKERPRDAEQDRDLDGFIARYLGDLDPREKPDAKDKETGRPIRLWDFRCPWNEHKDGGQKAWLLEKQDGMILVGCMADKCSGHNNAPLSKLLEKVAPDWQTHPELRALTQVRRFAELGQWAGEIEEQEVSWLWQNYFPRGQGLVIEGDPTTNKSTFCQTVAAIVSAGLSWPDGAPCERGNVLYLTTEDTPSTTIVPRLRVAGADMTPGRGVRVDRGYYVDQRTGQRKPLTLPDDLKDLEHIIRRDNFKLLVIDPLVGFLSSDINTHNDNEVRRKAMDPLAAMGERTDCTIIMLRHWTKGSDDTKLMYRGGGSIGIVGAVRACFAMAKLKPDDPKDGRRVLWPVKNNLTPPGIPTPLLLEVTSVEETGPSGNAISIAKLKWLPGGEWLKFADLFPGAKEKAASEEERAMRFWEDILSPTGTWKLKSAVQAAAHAAGFSEPTMRRARGRLAMAGYKVEDNGKRIEAAWRLAEPPF